MKRPGLLLLIAILLTACQPTATPTATPMASPTVVPPTAGPAVAPPTAAPIATGAATPPAAPVETLASSVNDVLGVWWFPSPGVDLEFKADGTFRFFYIDTTIDGGGYSFDNGKVFLTTPGTGGCNGKTATYDAYLTKQDGNPVGLRLQVVGSDPCPGRGDTTTHKAKFLHP